MSCGRVGGEFTAASKTRRQSVVAEPPPPTMSAATDAALQHPLGRSKLSLVDATKPSRRRVAFNARFTPRATMENPAFAGATLRIYGSAPTDGDSGLIELKAAKWHALGNAGSKG